RDDGRELHDADPPKPEWESEREHERIEQARAAARITVARRPFERMTPCDGAREIEVYEYVVERRGPVARREVGGGAHRRQKYLVTQRPVEQARDEQHARARIERKKRAFYV